MTLTTMMTIELKTTTMATWNKAISQFTAVILLCLTAMAAVAQVPARPDPPRLVNDFAGILGDCQWLEDSLEKIAMETSNQICVVTMNDFGGYDKAMMAYSIGEQWGVGKKGNNNGVVILIKPRAQVVRDLAIGEYNEEDYANQGDDGALFALVMFIFIFAFFLYLAHKSNQHNGGNRNSGDTGTWGGPIIFTSGHDWGRGGSSWGGGGSFGGGGWGGFGGGSFGGGGGGGSW